MRKLMLLAAGLAMVLIAAAPAVAQVGQEAEQDGDSGDVDQSFAVTGSGSNANQCAALLGGAQSGNSQNQIGITQSDDSEADDFELKDSGSNVVLSPELAEECEQIINQAASSAAAPGAAPAPKTEAKTATSKAEEKKTEAKAGSSTQAKAEAKKAEEKKAEQKKEQKKELPKTGGSGTAPLLALGAGALLVTGGLLVRRIFR